MESRCGGGRRCPAASTAVHPRSKLYPSRLRPFRPAMVTMKTLRHGQRPAMENFVRHDPRVPTNRTMPRPKRRALIRVRVGVRVGKVMDSGFEIEPARFMFCVRVPVVASPIVGTRNGREHLLDAGTFRQVCFAQPRSIARTRKPVALAASCPKAARRISTSDVILCKRS